MTTEQQHLYKCNTDSTAASSCVSTRTAIIHQHKLSAVARGQVRFSQLGMTDY